MPIEIIDDGKDNTLSIDPEYIRLGEGKIYLSGNNNKVIIKKPIFFGKLIIEAKDGANICIGDNCAIAGLWVTSLMGASIILGNNIRFNGGAAFRADENANISVGNDCLFAPDVHVWSSDMHPIIDAKSRKRINHPKAVTIEDHVWLCDRVKVLKGSTIRKNTVIGCHSVVAGEIPSNCVAVGVPAKVIKTGTDWDIDLV